MEIPNLLSKLIRELTGTPEHPPDEGTLRNVADTLATKFERNPLQLVQDRLQYDLWWAGADVRENLRGDEYKALPPEEKDQAVQRMVGDLRRTLEAKMRGLANPPAGGRRGGYRNVFEQWRTQYIPVRNDPQTGPEMANRILADLQTMYNAAATAVDAGTHVSPPQRVVFDNYEALITPVATDPNRTPGDLLRMLSALDSRLPAPPTSGGRRTQSKKFGSCVKAVRKTVKARKGSNPESAAIAICTKSMLFPRGRTIKRYKKGRLTTQKRRN